MWRAAASHMWAQCFFAPLRGDHDLFTFTCAIREELSAGRTTPGVGSGDNVQGIDGPGAPFLKNWQEAMVHWSSANREVLKGFWTG
jgi:hypothetical protein